MIFRPLPPTLSPFISSNVSSIYFADCRSDTDHRPGLAVCLRPKSNSGGKSGFRNLAHRIAHRHKHVGLASHSTSSARSKIRTKRPPPPFEPTSNHAGEQKSNLGHIFMSAVPLGFEGYSAAGQILHKTSARRVGMALFELHLALSLLVHTIHTYADLLTCHSSHHNNPCRSSSRP